MLQNAINLRKSSKYVLTVETLAVHFFREKFTIDFCLSIRIVETDQVDYLASKIKNGIKQLKKNSSLMYKCSFNYIFLTGASGMQQQPSLTKGVISFPTASAMTSQDWMVNSLDLSDSATASSGSATVHQTLMLQKQLMQQQHEQQQQQQFLLEKLLHTEQQYHQQQQLLERLLQDDESQGQLMQQV